MRQSSCHPDDVRASRQGLEISARKFHMKFLEISEISKGNLDQPGNFQTLSTCSSQRALRAAGQRVEQITR